MAKYGMTTAMGGRNRRERAHVRMFTRSATGTCNRVIGYVMTRPKASVTRTVEMQTITLFLSRTKNPRSIRPVDEQPKFGLSAGRARELRTGRPLRLTVRL